MKKTVAKSIRLNETIYNYIITYRGDGFNDKFENIIHDYMIREDDIKRNLESYSCLLDKERERYYNIKKQLDNLNSVVRKGIYIENLINGLNREIECITKDPGQPGKLQQK